MAALSMADPSRRSPRGGHHARTLITLLSIAPLLLAAARPACAQLAKVETREVRLVYVPDEAFVVPHAARTFLNSLAFQKRLFDFTPTERITVLLRTSRTAANAGARLGAAQRPCGADRAVELRRSRRSPATSA